MVDKENLIIEVAAKLKKISKEYDFTQEQLAAKIGINVSVVSQVLAGKYLYNPENYVWVQIDKFIKRIEAKIYDTKLMKVVTNMLNQAHKEKEIVVITSCSGAGKTTAIEQYCLNNPNAIHIRVNEVMNKKYLLQLLAIALNGPWQGLSMQQIYETVCELVTRKERTFVIDEAERLSVGQLEMLRDIYDQGNIGLALVGLDELRTLLQRGKTMRENLVQLYSRVGYQRVVNILEPDDIRLIFKDRFGKHFVTKEMIDHLVKTYQNKGGFRAIIKLVNNAMKTKQANPEAEYDDELIKYSINQLSL